MCARCVPTVLVVTNSACAISRFCMPEAASSATRRSDGVSASGPASMLPAWPRAGDDQLLVRAASASSRRPAALRQREPLPQRLARRGAPAGATQRAAQLDQRVRELEPAPGELRSSSTDSRQLRDALVAADDAGVGSQGDADPTVLAELARAGELPSSASSARPARIARRQDRRQQLSATAGSSGC